MNWQNVSQQDEQPTAHGNDVDWEGDEGEDLEPTPKMKTCFPVFCLSIPPQEVRASAPRALVMLIRLPVLGRADPALRL